jgi:hypothetical protein
MANARVHDIDVIRQFRAALVKFLESANSALTDSDGEITRKIGWLEGEQQHFWSMQVRKWNEEVNRAKDAVRQKRIFKDSLGRQQSTVDEEKHLKKCQRTLEEAEQKLENTRRHAKQLQREHLLYRGGVQRLATALSSDMPNAIAMLDRVTVQLEKYVSAAPTLATSEAGPDTTGAFGTDADGSMKRAVEPEDDRKKSDGGDEGESPSSSFSHVPTGEGTSPQAHTPDPNQEKH